MRSNFTFSSKVFESWADKFVWYLFETLPVATNFKSEPMLFLIEVYFWKVSKIGTILSKIKKIRKLWHLCFQLDELHPTFSPFACSNAKIIGSSILQNFSWFEQKLGSVCQTTCFFCCFTDFWVSLSQLPTKKCSYLQTCLLEIPGLVIADI